MQSSNHSPPKTISTAAFWGTAPRIFRLADRHADICLISPWMPQNKAKEAERIVLQEAGKQEENRQDFICRNSA